MKTTTRSAAVTTLMLSNLTVDLEAAVERANRTGKASDTLRVTAIRQEMTDVRLGR